MPLASGTRVGSYEISSPLGAGGMGEVYRARDVASKYYPPLEGEALSGPLPLAEALSIAKQIAEALEAAHERGSFIAI